MSLSADQGHPHLSKAPIVEASIEIRCTLSKPVGPEGFDRIRDALADRYPAHSPIHFLAPHFHIESETEVRTETAFSRIGVRLESADKKLVAQAHLDRLVVSQLEPYESWERLIAEMGDLWRRYCDVFAPVSVMRLGVRYINRIPLPFVDGRVDLDTVFTAGPKIPAALPQTLDQYMTRITVPFEQQLAMLAIVQTLEPPGIGAPKAAMLDLDAFSVTEMTPAGDEIWRQLELLRRVKNDAFFGSLHREIWETFL